MWGEIFPHPIASLSVCVWGGGVNIFSASDALYCILNTWIVGTNDLSKITKYSHTNTCLVIIGQ